MSIKWRQRIVALVVAPLIWVTASAEIDIIRTGGDRWACVEIVDGKDVPLPHREGQSPSTRLDYNTALECVYSYQKKYPDREFQSRSIRVAGVL